MDYRERAKERVEKFYEENNVPERAKFYLEELFKLQEEFKDVSNKETRRKLDLLNLIEKMEKSLSTYNVYIKSCKMYVNFNLTEGNKPNTCTIFVNDEIGVIRSSNLKEIAKYIKSYSDMQKASIWIDQRGIGIALYDALIDIDAKVNKLNVPHYFRQINKLIDKE